MFEINKDQIQGFEIKKDFVDGTKRISIDYKRIEEYNSPFVMTLKVKGKNKLDVYKVNNGKEAEEIRKKYKQENRYTSYVDFYPTIEDLIEEQGDENLQFKPRIRGKNGKQKELGSEERRNPIRTIDGSLSLHIYNQQLAGTIRFVAELKKITPSSLVSEIIEDYLKNKFKGE